MPLWNLNDDPQTVFHGTNNVPNCKDDCPSDLQHDSSPSRDHLAKKLLQLYDLGLVPRDLWSDPFWIRLGTLWLWTGLDMQMRVPMLMDLHVVFDDDC
jgi:hypothetical protein